jgi:hypothetical protein
VRIAADLVKGCVKIEWKCRVCMQLQQLEEGRMVAGKKAIFMHALDMQQLCLGSALQSKAELTFCLYSVQH